MKHIVSTRTGHVITFREIRGAKFSALECLYSVSQPGRSFVVKGALDVEIVEDDEPWGGPLMKIEDPPSGGAPAALYATAGEFGGKHEVSLTGYEFRREAAVPEELLPSAPPAWQAAPAESIFSVREAITA